MNGLAFVHFHIMVAEERAYRKWWFVYPNNYEDRNKWEKVREIAVRLGVDRGRMQVVPDSLAIDGKTRAMWLLEEETRRLFMLDRWSA